MAQVMIIKDIFYICPPVSELHCCGQCRKIHHPHGETEMAEVPSPTDTVHESLETKVPVPTEP